VVETLQVRSHLWNLKKLARVVVVTIDYQTDATAKLKGNFSVSRQLAQRRQRLIDVAGFYLPAREHQDDGF
jgi:hypothetical protein